MAGGVYGGYVQSVEKFGAQVLNSYVLRNKGLAAGNAEVQNLCRGYRAGTAI